jgi:periplasmic protein CpxP/Spy
MKTINLMLAMVFMTIAILAQNTPTPRNNQTPEERATQQTERLKKELKLTDDQEKKIYDINLSSSKKMDDIRKNSLGDRETARQKISDQLAVQDKQIKAVLKGDQLPKYEELKKQWEAERQQRRQGQPQGDGKKTPSAQ